MTIEESAKEDSPRDDEEILTEARERFAYVNEIDNDNRERAKADTEFVYLPGAQWDDKTRTMRTNWKDPCYEFNQLKQFVNQVVNDQRQSRPGIKVHPARGEASSETAEILMGMVRQIEYDSQAEAIYDNAYKHGVVGGRGYARLVSDWETDDGDSASAFNQKISLKPIADPNMVRLDPDYIEPDGSDRMWGFVIEAVKREEFERKWPDADPLSWSEIDAEWRDGDKFVFIADYYRRVAKKRTLVRMSNGAQGWKDEMPTPPDSITEVSSREMDSYSIEWFKIAGGQQILEEYTCPGDIVPVFCLPGDDTVINGQRMFQGLIRPARDAQSMFNYGMTQQAIHLALTPRAPWVASIETYEPYQNIYKNANTSNVGVLPYIEYDSMGRRLTPPHRTEPAPPNAGWINWTQQMTVLMRSTIGMYENSLGLHGQETSGVAIRQREKQGDNATFHYVDNLARFIALIGRVVVKWIPYYYDTQRIVHIIGKDGVRSVVTINQNSIDPNDPLKAIKLNDVTIGDYAVVVESGPSYATKRQETAETLTELAQANPIVMQLAPDLVVKSLDIPDADEMAERFQMGLPPQIQQMIAAKKNKQTPPDPQLMQKMQEQDQQLQQAAQTMDTMHQKIQEFESGMATEQLKEQGRTTAEQAKYAAEQDRVTQENVTKRYQSIVDAASKIVAQAMTLPPEQQADTVNAATAEMAPVMGDGDNMLREMSQGLMAMAQSMRENSVNVQELARIAAAPRETQLITDPTTGMPISSISQPYMGQI